MDRIRIRGGARLKGEIPISGAKNAAVALVTACLLTDEPVTFTNVPAVRDLLVMIELLRHLGVDARWMPSPAVGQGGRLTLTMTKVADTTAPYDIVRKMRASFLVLGPMLAREGKARVSLPGGDAIGARPVDFHIKALEALGATVTLEEGYIVASAPNGLKGAHIEFPFASVGATEHALFAAVLTKGETVIDNAAREPEVDDIGKCLIAMGAKITGLGTSRIVIEGVDRLHGTEHAVMPDRIEAGTFAAAVAMTGGEVELIGAREDVLASFLTLLRKAGAEVTPTNRGLSIYRNGGRLQAVDAVTEVYPGFATDLQAQFMAMMTVADGVSTIKETIFENRFMHVPELSRMGADIRVTGDTAVVTGVASLKGAPVMATDLRAGVCLIMGGLVADGETMVNRVYHVDRGFERLEEKLAFVGADIERLVS
ncbi:MAG TPA: UDP-N-acetylglucosamine 1-carboxyvinyltransferase [Rhizomicrobium sp.]|nr:UDP-N-acetylglucosamine 1-carboxyvinyltransferase [Rhizomicrobium sp.]